MNHYLLPALELSPPVFRRLIERIPSDRLDRPVVPGRFTPREVVAHLADWEPIMRNRISAAVNRPGSTIEVFDEAAMAVEHGYGTSNPAEQLAHFTSERAKTVELVRSIQPAQWRQTVVHPERGEQSTDDLANLLIGHDLYHIEQLTASLP